MHREQCLGLPGLAGDPPSSTQGSGGARTLVARNTGFTLASRWLHDSVTPASHGQRTGGARCQRTPRGSGGGPGHGLSLRRVQAVERHRVKEIAANFITGIASGL